MSNRPAHISNWLAFAALVLELFGLIGGKEWIEAQGWTLNPDAEPAPHGESTYHL